MDWLADPQAWVAFLTLTVLEIVLGIDDIIFIMISAVVAAVFVMMAFAAVVGDIRGRGKRPPVRLREP